MEKSIYSTKKLIYIDSKIDFSFIGCDLKFPVENLNTVRINFAAPCCDIDTSKNVYSSTRYVLNRRIFLYSCFPHSHVTIIEHAAGFGSSRKARSSLLEAR